MLAFYKRRVGVKLVPTVGEFRVAMDATGTARFTSDAHACSFLEARNPVPAGVSGGPRRVRVEFDGGHTGASRPYSAAGW